MHALWYAQTDLHILNQKRGDWDLYFNASFFNFKVALSQEIRKFRRPIGGSLYFQHNYQISHELTKYQLKFNSSQIRIQAKTLYQKKWLEIF